MEQVKPCIFKLTYFKMLGGCVGCNQLSGEKDMRYQKQINFKMCCRAQQIPNCYYHCSFWCNGCRRTVAMFTSVSKIRQCDHPKQKMKAQSERSMWQSSPRMFTKRSYLTRGVFESDVAASHLFACKTLVVDLFWKVWCWHLCVPLAMAWTSVDDASDDQKQLKSHATWMLMSSFDFFDEFAHRGTLLFF